MFGKCEKCSSKTVSHEDFNVDQIADSDSENSNTSDSDCDDGDQTAITNCYEWAREGTKLKKIFLRKYRQRDPKILLHDDYTQASYIQQTRHLSKQLC